MKNIFKYMRLFVSFYYAGRSKPESARKHLDKMLVELEEDVDFLEAYNARILMMEGRHQEARACLQSIVQKFSGTSDADECYMLKYSQFFLAIYRKDEVARELKSEAMDLNPRGSIKNFLPFFSDAAMSRILN